MSGLCVWRSVPRPWERFATRPVQLPKMTGRKPQRAEIGAVRWWSAPGSSRAVR
jgi:hypothetical protein